MQTCPKCEGDQVKKASLIHAEGIGFVRGAGIGTAGIAVGAGTSSTMIANKCAAPKREQSEFVGIFVAMVILLVVLLIAAPSVALYYMGLVFLPGILILPFVGIKQSRAATARHKLALAEYEKTFMCLRCGDLFKPFD
jgi:hypothetical protein